VIASGRGGGSGGRVVLVHKASITGNGKAELCTGMKR
jgi:hypothetical protein